MRRHATLLFVLAALLWQSWALAASAMQWGLDEVTAASPVAVAEHHATGTPAQSPAMNADDTDGAVEYLLADGTSQSCVSADALVPSLSGGNCSPPNLAETPGAPPFLPVLLRPPRGA